MNLMKETNRKECKVCSICGRVIAEDARFTVEVKSGDGANKVTMCDECSQALLQEMRAFVIMPAEEKKLYKELLHPFKKSLGFISKVLYALGVLMLVVTFNGYMNLMNAEVNYALNDCMSWFFTLGWVVSVLMLVLGYALGVLADAVEAAQRIGVSIMHELQQLSAPATPDIPDGVFASKVKNESQESSQDDER